MVNRQFQFKPGTVYTFSDTTAYYIFKYSELVMESFIAYHFNCISKTGTEEQLYHEQRDARFLEKLVEGNPGAQTLYSGKVSPGQIDKESL